jgi:hypothetical protein
MDACCACSTQQATFAMPEATGAAPPGAAAGQEGSTSPVRAQSRERSPPLRSPSSRGRGSAAGGGGGGGAGGAGRTSPGSKQKPPPLRKPVTAKEVMDKIKHMVGAPAMQLPQQYWALSVWEMLQGKRWQQRVWTFGNSLQATAQGSGYAQPQGKEHQASIRMVWMPHICQSQWTCTIPGAVFKYYLF